MKKTAVLYLMITLLIIITSCENEPFNNIQHIDATSELFDDLKSLSQASSNEDDAVCLTFIYPFNVYRYNANGEISSSSIVNDNIEFTNLLGNVEGEDAIGLSYPISGTAENGTVITINNNAELKEAIEACIEDQIIIYCTNLLQEKNCVWKVTSQTDNIRYDNSLFDFYTDGTGIFYHNGNAYRTSWISLFIDEELHVNIRLEGNSQATKDWNFDWSAVIIDENTIKISNPQESFTITQKCNVENSCDYVEFKECILPDSEYKAKFIFDHYSECIRSFRDTEISDDVTLAFYETMDDAKQEINPLDTSGYTNTMNPQIIFVTIKNKDTDAPKEMVRIVLFAESKCDEQEN